MGNPSVQLGVSPLGGEIPLSLLALSPHPCSKEVFETPRKVRAIRYSVGAFSAYVADTPRLVNKTSAREPRTSAGETVVAEDHLRPDYAIRRNFSQDDGELLPVEAFRGRSQR